MTYRDFCSFYRQVVVPAKNKNPGHKRLDGKFSGGSRDSAGEFIFGDRKWTVHTDTHYEPLQIAFEGFKKGPVPFEVKETARGLALVLGKEFRAKQKTNFKYMYIYSW